ncbi:NGG1p interacting factor NIF3 [Candidatus Formimonas warabiya]|uniref:NGG1p interacting factor NIF3 n=1 Tax=Formimonas warabiya TaxID=1761012 RepID=A0A3G1KND3_FORW1|nr:NGG1p interacting factor NIF3 [Candidatus Formimonas warabiya]ATW23930.1 NGG1p interacting factor NIF3 [Candidatus Formimonas warabiya]
MKLMDLYQLVVKTGMSADPRGEKTVEKDLQKTRKRWEKLEEKKREFFDQESLSNPYSDTRILFGEPETEVSTLFTGIDIEMGEILLADRLREKGEKIDLVLSHHPEGYALAGLYEVMHIQEGIMAGLGVPINVAEGLLASRIPEVKRGFLPFNHNRTVDAARILGIPFMSAHTPADNLVTAFLIKYLAEKGPDTLDELIEVLKEIPEYRNAAKLKAGPTIVLGLGKRSVGKIFVDMTGGTSGSEDAFEKLAIAGVGTIVGMHMGEKHRKNAEKYHINVVIAGHMASDSLGMNLLLDRIEEKGVRIIPVAGLDRVARR